MGAAPCPTSLKSMRSGAPLLLTRTFPACKSLWRTTHRVWIRFTSRAAAQFSPNFSNSLTASSSLTSWRRISATVLHVVPTSADQGAVSFCTLGTSAAARVESTPRSERSDWDSKSHSAADRIFQRRGPPRSAQPLFLAGMPRCQAGGGVVRTAHPRRPPKLYLRSCPRRRFGYAPYRCARLRGTPGN